MKLSAPIEIFKNVAGVNDPGYSHVVDRAYWNGNLGY
jgi:hypothetical protein